MNRILVSLTGEQTIPNTTFIYENNHEFDLYYFISTQAMESRGRTDMVISASGIPSQKVKKILVVEDSVKDILNKLAMIKPEPDTFATLNLTGGTKLMSLLTFNYFTTAFGKNCSAYYMPIGRNSIERIFPFAPDQKYITPISYRFDLKTYLKALGLVPQPESKCARTVGGFDLARRMFELHVCNRLDFEAVREIRHLLKTIPPQALSGHPIDITDNRMVNELLKRHKLFIDGPFTREKAEYLAGAWFEEYCYFLIKDTLSLPGNAIWNAVTADNHGAINEFDVLFLSGNTLSVVECKTGLKNPFTDKSIINETIYKLEALKKSFGLQTKCYVVTLDTNLRGARGDFKPSVKSRAAQAEIYIADRPVLATERSAREFINKMK